MNTQNKVYISIIESESNNYCQKLRNGIWSFWTNKTLYWISRLWQWRWWRESTRLRWTLQIPMGGKQKHFKEHLQQAQPNHQRNKGQARSLHLHEKSFCLLGLGLDEIVLRKMVLWPVEQKDKKMGRSRSLCR